MSRLAGPGAGLFPIPFRRNPIYPFEIGHAQLQPGIHVVGIFLQGIFEQRNGGLLVAGLGKFDPLLQGLLFRLFAAGGSRSRWSTGMAG